MIEKSEIRISKSETNPNIKCPNVLNCSCACLCVVIHGHDFSRIIRKIGLFIVSDFEFLSFDIVSDFEFRYSDLNCYKYKNSCHIANLLSMSQY
jgi:hypothetical protein